MPAKHESPFREGQLQETQSYVLPPEMHVFEKDEQFLYFDPVGFVWFQTDELGRRVMDGLMSKGSVEDAAHSLASFAQAPLEDAHDYSQRYVRQLLDIGFLHEDKYSPPNFASGIAKNPYLLYLHMASACNLKCPYCYNQENRHQLRQQKVGTYDQFAALIDEAEELGFRYLKFTGGEALINKDTIPLARYAREKGFDNNLLTNGTLVDESNAAGIAEVMHAVSISLDSPHPEEHDAVRGKDTWRKVLRAIRLLRQAGLKFLHLNASVSPVTKNSVEAFLEFAWDDLQAEKVTVSQALMDVADPDSRWGASEYSLTAEDAWDIYKQQKNYRRRKVGDEKLAVSRSSLRRRQCGAGNGLVSIDSNGDLYPCQTMHTPELKCGNAFEQGLRQIIRTSELLKNVRTMTVDRLQDCPTCPMRYICSGGCRMEAYSREGAMDARNRDLCPLFFQRGMDKLWATANLPANQAHEPPQGRTRPLDFIDDYI